MVLINGGSKDAAVSSDSIDKVGTEERANDLSQNVASRLQGVDFT